jgi:uncharacterized protein (TIGR00645 family)
MKLTEKIKAINVHQACERIVFSARWMLYPVNLGLLGALVVYILRFLVEDYHFLTSGLDHSQEAMMLLMLSFVDAAMVANLIVMIAQGGHQLFISKFDLKPGQDRPQYLDHIDTGILKVKIALSICGITLIQILKDFVNIEKLDWTVIYHRGILHILTLISALVVALIWRITHPVHKESA